MLDADLLSAGTNIPRERAERWVEYLNEAMTAFDISTPHRVSAFVAQCAHESAFFTAWVENLNYKTAAVLMKTFGRGKFPTVESCTPYLSNPVGLANYVYSTRLGNNQPGDGWRFIARGLIGITGRTNYERCSEGLAHDYVGNPELLLEPWHAAMASAWWWADQSWRGVTLNEYADDGMIDCISGMVNRGNPDKIAVHADERRRIYRDMIETLMV